jgi:hypothetical protein
MALVDTNVPGRFAVVVARALDPMAFIPESLWNSTTPTATWIEGDVVEDAAGDRVGRRASCFVWGVAGRRLAAGDRVYLETRVKKTKRGRDLFATYLRFVKCDTCGRLLDVPSDPRSTNCGGDCLQCMADAGDPDCIKSIAALCICARCAKYDGCPNAAPPPDDGVHGYEGICTDRREDKRHAGHTPERID